MVGQPAVLPPVGQPAVVPGQPAVLPPVGQPAVPPVPGQPAVLPPVGQPAVLPVPGQPAVLPPVGQPAVVPGQPAVLPPVGQPAVVPGQPAVMPVSEAVLPVSEPLVSPLSGQPTKTNGEAKDRASSMEARFVRMFPGMPGALCPLHRSAQRDTGCETRFRMRVEVLVEITP